MFNNTRNTSSNNNMANLLVASLTISNAYTSTITLGETLKVSGTLTMEVGTIAGAVGKKLQVPSASSTFTWKGGTISAAVEVGSATAAPTLRFDGGAVTIGGTFTTYASATWTGTGDITLEGGSLTNYGTFDVRVDKNIAVAGLNAQIQNNGTFKKSLGVGTSEIRPIFTNATGTVLAGSGTLYFKTGGYRQSQASGTTTLNGGNITADSFKIDAGIVNGIGTITANVENTGGYLIPGTGNASGGTPGTLNIAGNYTQGASGTFVVNFDAAGNHGVLNVQQVGLNGGSATLGGTIRVNRPAGYTPSQGTDFDVLTTTNGITGEFATFDIPNNAWNNGGPREFQVIDWEPTAVRILVL